MKKIAILSTLIFIMVGLVFAAEMELTGAGASFPYPLYSKMFLQYNSVTGTKVNYQAIGSGGGVRQIKAKTVDFGASDAYLSDKKLSDFTSEMVHIPTTAGAVVVAYNIPGNPKLNLTGEIISEIFLGKITRWNDQKIVKHNKNIKIPDMAIIVAHRSDGSGTTFIFSDYLSKVSPEWKEKVGTGKALKWPAGIGGKGNAGVSGLIKQIRGAIGYIELAYSIQNKIPYASIQNSSGNFVEPSLESVSKAADTRLPDDMRVKLTNTPAKHGYPISGFTWLLSYKDLSKIKNPSMAKAKELVNLFSWMITDGQKACAPLHYAPLSPTAVKKTSDIIKQLNYGGKAIK